MTNSRNKGKKGELEFKDFLKDRGYDARRGQQYCGANGDADVVGVPGMHVEVKRTETCRPYQYLEQAVKDARIDEVPVVFHRQNRRQWIVIMDAGDFMDLYEMAQAAGRDGSGPWDKMEDYL